VAQRIGTAVSDPQKDRAHPRPRACRAAQPDLRFNVSRRRNSKTVDSTINCTDSPFAPPISLNWSPDIASLGWHNEQRYLG
jgi:hypothetical protein